MAVKAIVAGLLLIVLGVGALLATKGPDSVDATSKVLKDGGNLGDAISKDSKAIGDHLDAAADRAAETLRTGEVQRVEPKYKKTALIPAAFGLALLLCGALALKESRKKHAMHAAAMVGLLGWVDEQLDEWKRGVPEAVCTVGIGGVVAMRPLLLARLRASRRRRAPPRHPYRICVPGVAKRPALEQSRWPTRVNDARIDASPR